MNGMAQVSAFWPVNLCKCGHDYLSHTNPTSQTGTCLQCTTSAGPHVHGFCSTNEVDPSTQFPEPLPVRFVNAGGLGTYVTPQTTTSGLGNTAGATTITLTSTAGAVAGGVVRIGAIAALEDLESYTIERVISATQLLITPGLLVTYAAGTPAQLLGRQASTMGAACPPNGQRAG